MLVRYNRELNKQTYRWGLFKDSDFIVFASILVATLLFTTIYVAIIFALIMVLYIGYFRYNRPRGYDVHFFKSLSRPARLRAGKEDRIFKR